MRWGIYLVVVGLVLVAVGLVPCAVAATSPPAKGEIGGPPSTALGPPPHGVKQITPAIVIGRGKRPAGRLELAAYGWNPSQGSESSQIGLCIWIEQPPTEFKRGRCGSVSELAPSAIPIRVYNISSLIVPKSKGSWTELSGSVAPSVASVQVLFSRDGSPQQYRVNAVVAQVSGELQARLKQPAPFGYFVAKIRGSVVRKTLHVRAFDAAGHLIDSAR
jgi:hypothetical protein